MEGGPLSSSLMARRELVAEQQQQVISDEQIRQLLIFMGTITVISFVLVIALITVFIAFIWYSRSRLQGCACHRGVKKQGDKELELEGGSALRHAPHPLQPPDHHTVKMFAVEPGQFQLKRSHKNVIVNPLPGTLLHHQPLTGGRGGTGSSSRTDLVAPINQSVAGGAGGVREVDELDQIESGGSQQATEEPIYAEINFKPSLGEIKPNQGEIKPNQGEIKLEKILKAEQESENPPGGGIGGGKKKEIEYWQITAKEVVKFRPCTETFIQRE